MPRAHVVSLLLVFLALVAASASADAEPAALSGTVKGRVIDRDLRAPLEGVLVALPGAGRETATDAAGQFVFDAVPPGTFVVHCRYPGMAPALASDVVVRASRTTFVLVEYALRLEVSESLTVSGGFFPEPGEQPASTVSFSSEEIRRAPGTAGDVTRIVYSLPSVGKIADTVNALVVRGGSPSENAFFIDNIEVPNINHFPVQGSSIGPIGLLNVDFVRDLRFTAGGFDASFGGKLSSVMDIAYREGNRERTEVQIDTNLAGAGLTAEGPLGGNGSWLVSARRSYLDLIVGLMDEDEDDGNVTVPRFGDVQGKLAFDLGDRDALTVLLIAGDDAYREDRDDALEDGEEYYGRMSSREGVFGANWTHLWGARGYSETSLAYSATRFLDYWSKTLTDRSAYENRSTEQALSLRNVNRFTLAPGRQLRCGVEARRLRHDYAFAIAEWTDDFGVVRPGVGDDVRKEVTEAGVFAELVVKPVEKLTLVAGARGEHVSASGRTYASPRLAATWSFTPRTALTASGGRFVQPLPLAFYRSSGDRSELRDPRADHAVLGLSHLLTEATRLTVEVYRKEYSDLPMDPDTPWVSLVDEAFGGGLFFRERVVGGGRGRADGIEVAVQKKMRERFYGMAGVSASRSRYRGLDGAWRARPFDDRVRATLEGGYKASQTWEFSARWLIAGGRPTTPFDLAASAARNEGVLDHTRVNDERLPAYHSLNLRVDRRTRFAGGNLTVFLDVWNVYNRANVATMYWDEKERRPAKGRQFGRLPVLGFELEL